MSNALRSNIILYAPSFLFLLSLTSSSFLCERAVDAAAVDKNNYLNVIMIGRSYCSYEVLHIFFLVGNTHGHIVDMQIIFRIVASFMRMKRKRRLKPKEKEITNLQQENIQ